jgi:hypothetical protein
VGKGKTANKTNATSKNNREKTHATKTSAVDAPLDSTQRNVAITAVTRNEAGYTERSQPFKFNPSADPSKQRFLLLNNALPGQPISVNISISNNVMPAAESAPTSARNPHESVNSQGETTNIIANPSVGKEQASGRGAQQVVATKTGGSHTKTMQKQATWGPDLQTPKESKKLPMAKVPTTGKMPNPSKGVSQSKDNIRPMCSKDVQESKTRNGSKAAQDSGKTSKDAEDSQRLKPEVEARARADVQEQSRAKDNPNVKDHKLSSVSKESKRISIVGTVNDSTGSQPKLERPTRPQDEVKRKEEKTLTKAETRHSIAGKQGKQCDDAPKSDHDAKHGQEKKHDKNTSHHIQAAVELGKGPKQKSEAHGLSKTQAIACLQAVNADPDPAAHPRHLLDNGNGNSIENQGVNTNTNTNTNKNTNTSTSTSTNPNPLHNPKDNPSATTKGMMQANVDLKHKSSSNRESLQVERPKDSQGLHPPRHSTVKRPPALINSIIETACVPVTNPFLPSTTTAASGQLPRPFEPTQSAQHSPSGPNLPRRPSGTERHPMLVSSHKHKAPAKRPPKLVLPVPASQVLRRFASLLTDYEKAELLDYNEIHYIGRELVGRTKAEPRRDDDDNYGYDDYKGDYRVYEGEHIAYRYEILDILGKGSFGQALKCFDHYTKQMVALKVIRSKKRFYYQATVEVKILKYIKENDVERRSNVVSMLEFFMFRKHIVREWLRGSVSRLSC